MTVVTTRPNATVSASGFNYSAGSRHACLSDDSDSTFVAGVSTAEQAVIGFAEPTGIPGGARVVALAARVRSAKLEGTPRLTVAVIPYGGDAAGVGYLYPTWTTPTTTTVVAGATIDTVPTDLRVLLYNNTEDNFRLHELYVDTVYVAKPDLSISWPTGTLTDQNRPKVAWTPTLDADGGAQTRFEVRIFNSAQYTAGGFDPATSACVVEATLARNGRIEVGGDAREWRPADPLPDGTYRAYVRVAQTLKSTTAFEYFWSDWHYSAFTIDVPTPGIPIVSAVADDERGAIDVSATHQAGDIATTHLEFQYSRDGETWLPLRVPGDGATEGVVAALDSTAVDLEAPNSVPVSYRVRARHSFGEEGLSLSDWSTTATATWQSADWWLKAPERPDLNTIVVPNSIPGHQRPARQGVFQALGSPDTVIVSDTRTASRGTLKLQVDTDEEAAAIDALLDSGLTLLLQGPPEHHWPDRYLRFGDQTRDRWIDKAWIGESIDTLPWFEVARPPGPIDQWPEPGS